MKVKSRIILALLVCAVALSYTACKKLNDNSPNKSTVDTKTVSTQVALNVVAALNGSFGGFNLNDGLDAPTNLGVVHQGGLRINDVSDGLCGTVVDTTYSDNETGDDGTASSVKIQLKLTYNCTNGIVSGYHIQDSLSVAATSAQYTGTYSIGQNLTLQSLNPSDDQSKFTINGTNNLDLNVKYKTNGSTQNFDDVFDYKFNTVVIDPSNDDDVISGTANFYTKGVISNGQWTYIGTITFLGNHQAKITINGTTYNVNLQTGVVS